jgi:predicted methyltransferase
MKNAFLFTIAAVALAACGPQSPPADEAGEREAAETHAAPAGDVYAQAVARTTRLEGDYARDAGRKPAQVLGFFGVSPGMTVLDMFSGGGYYSELLAYVVGSEGRVVAHSNEAYLTYVGDEFQDRHAQGRLDNVEVLMAENNELSLSEGEFDAIMIVLGFHDIYYDNAEGGWPRIDEAKLLAELHKGLKDDGFIGIIDHHAEEGAPSDSGNTVHRIDRALVIERMAAAGFELVDESDLLRNPDDDRTIDVFNAEVRGKTDRFILKFVKAG